MFALGGVKDYSWLRSSLTPARAIGLLHVRIERNGPNVEDQPMPTAIETTASHQAPPGGDWLPPEVLDALRRVVDHLWKDRDLAATYLETSPLEGRSEHIFEAVFLLRCWMDRRPLTTTTQHEMSSDGRKSK